MKQLKLIITSMLVLITGICFSQQKPPLKRSTAAQVVSDRALQAIEFMGIPHGLTPSFPAYAPDSIKCGSLFYLTDGVHQGVLKTYDCVTNTWVTAGGTILTVPSTITSSIPQPGYTTNSVQDLINGFYQTQPPTASLTTSGNLPVTSAATTPQTLTYTYGKQTGTLNIASATINGSTTGITQSTTGATGSYGVNVPTNAIGSQTYTLVVTTTDSKTATSTVTKTILDYRYWGRTAATVPNNATIIANAGGGNELSASKAKSGFTISASGNNYIYYAYPASEGLLTSILVGGFESFPVFTLNTITVTNSSGYSESYNVYVSNNTYSATTPTITVQ